MKLRRGRDNKLISTVIAAHDTASATSNAAEAKIKVVIVEDQPMVAQMFVRVISREHDFELVGVATSISDTLTLLQRHTPQVVLMDYQLPDGDGAEASEKVLLRWPDIKILMLSGLEGRNVVLRAIEAGCVGFLAKTRPAIDVVHAIRAAASGELMTRKSELAALYDEIKSVDVER